MLKRLSIRSKFIFIISLLLAAVLSLQFYFTNRAHREILSEIETFTRSFNKTTDAYFFGDNDHQTIIVEDDLLIKKDKDPLIDLEKIHENIMEIELDQHQVRQNVDKAMDELIKLRSRGRMPVLRKKNGTKGFSFSYNDSNSNTFILHDPDSLKQKLKTFELRIDQVESTSVALREKWVARKSAAQGNKKAGSFSFIIPDFSKPADPRILEYRYSTEELNDVIRKMRNRNALITLLLFGLSIVGVIFIAQRFLQPIRSLNESFDRVVDGDLTVSVEPKSGDEIGELTRSFNKMVSELKKNKEKENLIQRKERLASLGQLAAGVAHEVKNPLNAINLTIEHLQDKFVDATDSQASAYIDSIQGEIKRLDKTVNNFLNYIRSEHLERKQTDINQLIMEILNLYERELLAGSIEVETDFAEDFHLNVDRERFKTALVNIILNAFQAMESKGRLRIQTDAEHRKIIISDSGCGIDQKDLNTIFDLFYTTKSTGTGLGLPTAYKIIKEHQGEIMIESKKGQGSTVHINM